MNSFFQWIADLLKQGKFWVIVLPWELAVRVRAGKHTRILRPGWHWRIPILDDVRVFNNRLRIATFPSLTVTSKDGKTVTAAGMIAFRITDPLRVMLAIQAPETTCSGLGMAYAARYLSERAFDEVSVATLEATAAEALRGQVPGCTFEWVRLTDFAAVRTYRLLQDQWRPSTNPDAAL